jgi:AraC-like DNA-binding protein
MEACFSYYVEDASYHLKYAKGKPSALGREFHNYDEMVLFLNGSAQFLSKSIQLALTPGTLVLIPREQFHQFVVTQEERYTRCILGFRSTPGLKPLVDQVMGQITVIPHPSERTLQLFYQLMDSAQKGLPEQELLWMLPAALTMLMIEQKLCDAAPIRERVAVSEVTLRAMEHIDGNLAHQLTLSAIAQALNVSVSTLSHRFKEDLNIPVYRYIVKKRLSVAGSYIEQGMPLNTVAALSGFTDYAGFFRLYKKYYGHAPGK